MNFQEAKSERKRFVIFISLVVISVLSLILWRVGCDTVYAVPSFSPSPSSDGILNVDMKINNSDGQLMVGYNTPLEFSWTSENADFCYAYGDPSTSAEWRGSLGLSGKKYGVATSPSTEYAVFCGNNSRPELATDYVFVSTFSPTPSPTPPDSSRVMWNCLRSAYRGRQIWTCSGQSRYRCVNGAPVSEYCSNGCIIRSLGQDDECAGGSPSPSPPPSPSPSPPPSPSPSPPPTFGYCSVEYLRGFWNSQNLNQYWYDGMIANDASRVCMCESGGNPSARLYRPPNEDSRGLFQINIVAHRNYTVSRLYEPVYNIMAAIDVFKARASYLRGCTNKRAGWEPWSCAKPPYNIYKCN